MSKETKNKMKYARLALEFGPEFASGTAEIQAGCAGGYSGFGICPKAYQGCKSARDPHTFENICSREYLHCGENQNFREY